MRRLSQKRGMKKPTTPPMSRKSGLPRVGKKGLSRNMMAGTPMVQPTQIMMYSETFSLRSARASSRARLAPKSRSSTRLLIEASAALLARKSLTGPSPVFLGAASLRPEA